ncbi:FAD-binding domain-containing protein [Tuwongella immobilis]|uniref:Photolyase/cryptochrome alpha/beta domain-containing protein n=1 Tax=Tuwongella immobilis TaxID=692036 RepID=A0A6C2YPT3_9BACT|nr:FAD-binding domain-containing protein [Tuwongella immobilis]VIP03189.1 deoxyribodipyrimidine photo-lyase : DNA photolyase FAD-binding protein OS=Isosphaera pallida (strain ATCC 43644 / DSM 9630 / IS1B) GN=Isop_3295 PE=3 SV=1: DNA_photolyase: FAD_binding_7 [Tuwongella immobilis]VTS03654.1 deoxyribodipyrimidine photo-lyase : DNA photolyase FAD-binding protein OS=Isosphaera pallida (strain ATCC 43644 / DSM 9630 / IS1B) GN=Isop_3295 PE=3 SV=1: DNA_photolyase: FAD_binding_7 [Tuwongella immobilis]
MNGPLAIWWIKRDFRLEDNLVLSEGVKSYQQILPVYCEEPGLLALEDRSILHQQACRQAVASLRRSLARLGSGVFLCHHHVIRALEQIRNWYPFTAILSHEEIGCDWTYRRDRQVRDWCDAHGIHDQEFPQTGVKRGGINRDRFTQFWNSRIVDQKPLPVPTRIPLAETYRQRALESQLPPLVGIPSHADAWQTVTEPSAHQVLTSFASKRGYGYSGGISSPNRAFQSGSRLSVHLAWGTITPRSIYHTIQQYLRQYQVESSARSTQWQRSLQAFLSRLHWRDHFMQRFEMDTDLEFRSLHPNYRDIPYSNREDHLEAWVHGQTGFPLIDAVMRCLHHTGFVNFRMRAMTVSFACHALHLDWRLIHPYLSGIFRDYEPGIHWNQLQMQAGVSGINTIRVYDPQKQLREQDPQAEFVREWIPELRHASIAAIHDHHRNPIPGYPRPIVDFDSATRFMKSALFGIQQLASSRLVANSIAQRHGSRKRPTSSGSRRSRSAPITPSSQASLFD